MDRVLGACSVYFFVNKYNYYITYDLKSDYIGDYQSCTNLVECFRLNRRALAKQIRFALFIAAIDSPLLCNRIR